MDAAADAQDSRTQQATIPGLTQRLDQHPVHGTVLWFDGHRGNYLTKPALADHIATLQGYLDQM